MVIRRATTLVARAPMGQICMRATWTKPHFTLVARGRNGQIHNLFIYVASNEARVASVATLRTAVMHMTQTGYGTSM